MAFRVFDDPQLGAYFVLLIVCAFISIVAVVLRFVATSISHRKLGLEDWLAFTAVVVFLTRIGVAFAGTSARLHTYVAFLLVRVIHQPY